MAVLNRKDEYKLDALEPRLLLAADGMFGYEPMAEEEFNIPAIEESFENYYSEDNDLPSLKEFGEATATSASTENPGEPAPAPSGSDAADDSLLTVDEFVMPEEYASEITPEFEMEELMYGGSASVEAIDPYGNLSTDGPMGDGNYEFSMDGYSSVTNTFNPSLMTGVERQLFLAFENGLDVLRKKILSSEEMVTKVPGLDIALSKIFSANNPVILEQGETFSSLLEYIRLNEEQPSGYEDTLKDQKFDSYKNQSMEDLKDKVEKLSDEGIGGFFNINVLDYFEQNNLFNINHSSSRYNLKDFGRFIEANLNLHIKKLDRYDNTIKMNLTGYQEVDNGFYIENYDPAFEEKYNRFFTVSTDYDNVHNFLTIDIKFEGFPNEALYEKKLDFGVSDFDKNENVDKRIEFFNQDDDAIVQIDAEVGINLDFILNADDSSFWFGDDKNTFATTGNNNQTQDIEFDYWVKTNPQDSYSIKTSLTGEYKTVHVNSSLSNVDIGADVNLVLENANVAETAWLNALDVSLEDTADQYFKVDFNDSLAFESEPDAIAFINTLEYFNDAGKLPGEQPGSEYYSLLSPKDANVVWGDVGDYRQFLGDLVVHANDDYGKIIQVKTKEIRQSIENIVGRKNGKIQNLIPGLNTSISNLFLHKQGNTATPALNAIFNFALLMDNYASKHEGNVTLFGFVEHLKEQWANPLTSIDGGALTSDINFQFHKNEAGKIIGLTLQYKGQYSENDKILTLNKNIHLAGKNHDLNFGVKGNLYLDTEFDYTILFDNSTDENLAEGLNLKKFTMGGDFGIEADNEHEASFGPLSVKIGSIPDNDYGSANFNFQLGYDEEQEGIGLVGTNNKLEIELPIYAELDGKSITKGDVPTFNWTLDLDSEDWGDNANSPTFSNFQNLFKFSDFKVSDIIGVIGKVNKSLSGKFHSDNGNETSFLSGLQGILGWTTTHGENIINRYFEDTSGIYGASNYTIHELINKIPKDDDLDADNNNELFDFTLTKQFNENTNNPEKGEELILSFKWRMDEGDLISILDEMYQYERLLEKLTLAEFQENWDRVDELIKVLEGYRDTDGTEDQWWKVKDFVDKQTFDDLDLMDSYYVAIKNAMVNDDWVTIDQMINSNPSDTIPKVGKEDWNKIDDIIDRLNDAKDNENWDIIEQMIEDQINKDFISVDNFKKVISTAVENKRDGDDNITVDYWGPISKLISDLNNEINKKTENKGEFSGSEYRGPVFDLRKTDDFNGYQRYEMVSNYYKTFLSFSLDYLKLNLEGGFDLIIPFGNFNKLKINNLGLDVELEAYGEKDFHGNLFGPKDSISLDDNNYLKMATKFSMYLEDVDKEGDEQREFEAIELFTNDGLLKKIIKIDSELTDIDENSIDQNIVDYTDIEDNAENTARFKIEHLNHLVKGNKNNSFLEMDIEDDDDKGIVFSIKNIPGVVRLFATKIFSEYFFKEDKALKLPLFATSDSDGLKGPGILDLTLADNTGGVVKLKMPDIEATLSQFFSEYDFNQQLQFLEQQYFPDTNSNSATEFTREFDSVNAVKIEGQNKLLKAVSGLELYLESRSDDYDDDLYDTKEERDELLDKVINDIRVAVEILDGEPGITDEFIISLGELAKSISKIKIRLTPGKIIKAERYVAELREFAHKILFRVPFLKIPGVNINLADTSDITEGIFEGIVPGIIKFFNGEAKASESLEEFIENILNINDIETDGVRNPWNEKFSIFWDTENSLLNLHLNKLIEYHNKISIDFNFSDIRKFVEKLSSGSENDNVFLKAVAKDVETLLGLEFGTKGELPVDFLLNINLDIALDFSDTLKILKNSDPNANFLDLANSVKVLIYREGAQIETINNGENYGSPKGTFIETQFKIDASNLSGHVNLAGFEAELNKGKLFVGQDVDKDALEKEKKDILNSIDATWANVESEAFRVFAIQLSEVLANYNYNSIKIKEIYSTNNAAEISTIKDLIEKIYENKDSVLVHVGFKSGSAGELAYLANEIDVLEAKKNDLANLIYAYANEFPGEVERDNIVDSLVEASSFFSDVNTENELFLLLENGETTYLKDKVKYAIRTELYSLLHKIENYSLIDGEMKQTFLSDLQHYLNIYPDSAYHNNEYTSITYTTDILDEYEIAKEEFRNAPHDDEKEERYYTAKSRVGVLIDDLKYQFEVFEYEENRVIDGASNSYDKADHLINSVFWLFERVSDENNLTTTLELENEAQNFLLEYELARIFDSKIAELFEIQETIESIITQIPKYHQLDDQWGLIDSLSTLLNDNNQYDSSIIEGILENQNSSLILLLQRDVYKEIYNDVILNDFDSLIDSKSFVEINEGLLNNLFYEVSGYVHAELPLLIKYSGAKVPIKFVIKTVDGNAENVISVREANELALENEDYDNYSIVPHSNESLNYLLNYFIGSNPDSDDDDESKIVYENSPFEIQMDKAAHEFFSNFNFKKSFLEFFSNPNNISKGITKGLDLIDFALNSSLTNSSSLFGDNGDTVGKMVSDYVLSPLRTTLKNFEGEDVISSVRKIIFDAFGPSGNKSLMEIGNENKVTDESGVLVQWIKLVDGEEVKEDWMSGDALSDDHQRLEFTFRIKDIFQKDLNDIGAFLFGQNEVNDEIQSDINLQLHMMHYCHLVMIRI